MSDPVSARRDGDPGLSAHAHHWLIGDRGGPSSPAVCKECGERREFSNGFVRRKPVWVTRSSVIRPDTGGSANGRGP
jgi:hypothetical protein